MSVFRSKKALTITLLLGVAGVLTWSISQRFEGPRDQAARNAERPPAPVAVAAIEHGPIELRRTFTGTIEARAEFVVAPKVGGRVEQLHVDLADAVTRGQVVAVLDDAEYVQAVARARADLEVAQANNAEAASLLKIADRELQRVDNLRERGLSSESQSDAAMAEQLAKQALVRVTRAQIARAEADLAAARIRLGYTQVTAGWRGGNERRLVAERYVDEGETVAANAPLLRIVELDPITAVFFVTERDYARLRPGQSATLSANAFPEKEFHGVIQRIAPVFRESTRQAQVELLIANPQLHLKPGMFARATVVLDRVAEAIIVPEEALTKRRGREGVFLVSADGGSVAWQEVQSGIRQDKRVQLTGEALSGRVVILGQQLLDHGKPIRIAAQNASRKP